MGFSPPGAAEDLLLPERARRLSEFFRLGRRGGVLEMAPGQSGRFFKIEKDDQTRGAAPSSTSVFAIPLARPPQPLVGAHVLGPAFRAGYGVRHLVCANAYVRALAKLGAWCFLDRAFRMADAQGVGSMS